MVPRADINGRRIGDQPLREVVATHAVGTATRAWWSTATHLDDVLGIVHLKDLLPFWGDGARFSLEQVMRPLLVVPPSMRVLDLLLEMRETRKRIAVVVDEFGGTDGLVTIEDLVEEIVGELADEHDRVGQPQLVENPDGSIDADGRVYLEELEEKLGVALLEGEDRDEADTLGGLIFTLVDRVPTRGEIVPHPSGLEFEVLDADPRRIKRVRIRRAGRRRDATPPDAAGRSHAACRPWLERRPALAAFARGLATGGGPAAGLPACRALAGLRRARWRSCGMASPDPGTPSCAGTAFGFGFFLAGLYWVGIAFFADAERFGVYAVPAVLVLALFLALTVGLAAAIVALRRWRSVDGAGAGLRGRLDHGRAVARRRSGCSFPGTRSRSVWAVSDADAAGRRLHRHLWAQPADRGRGRPRRRPGSCRAWPARAAALAAPSLLACRRARRRRAAPRRGARAAGHRTFGCASSRPTSRSTTNGIPSKRLQWFRRHLELSRLGPRPAAAAW